MSSLEIRVDPGAMGFEPARLERIRPHFDAYVEDRRLAGWLATVARGGELVWTAKGGYRDREKDLEVTDDTIWRIYSMTKPITSIAVMMLYEEGRFDLNDDVGQWIDALKEPRVWAGGTAWPSAQAPAGHAKASGAAMASRQARRPVANRGERVRGRLAGSSGGMLV